MSGKAFTLSTYDIDFLEQLLNSKGDVKGALLPILQDIQKKYGYINPDFVPVVAKGLNLSRAEVYGVISFYHDFRTVGPGKTVIKLCRAEACQSMAGRDLEAHVKQKLGIGYHQTTANGKVTLEPVYCLGNCACAPAMLVDDELHGRMTADKFDAVLGKNGRIA